MLLIPPLSFPLAFLIPLALYCCSLSSCSPWSSPTELCSAGLCNCCNSNRDGLNKELKIPNDR